MLSRLISLLRRIPAVNWALTRLRPLPHSGSIDVAPIAADDSPAVIIEDVIIEDVIVEDVIVEDVAEAAPASITNTSTEPERDDAGLAVGAPVAVNDMAASVIAQSQSTASFDISIGDGSLRATPAEVEPLVVDEAAVSSAEVESEPASELVIVSHASADVPAEAEPVADDVPVLLVEANGLTAGVPEASTDSGPSASVEIAPVLANDPPLAAAIATEASSAGAPSVVTYIEPAPALVSPSPEIRSTPKVRARAAEPADRGALIRQRWAETGIRMWNPRLHGTGEATLNIQGSVGLLPPAPGETMPRYDKLEFKMLGGQIVCEGVIVEAPAQASHRSFTRLAEPGNTERVREPVRERQAALA